MLDNGPGDAMGNTEHAEHAPGGPYGGAWQHTLGPNGESQMVYRIEAELKLALLRNRVEDTDDLLREARGWVEAGVENTGVTWARDLLARIDAHLEARS